MPLKTPKIKTNRTLCLLFDSPAPIAQIAEACFRFTPKIATRKASLGAIFLDLALDPDPATRAQQQASVIARARALCARFKALPRLAFGDDPGMALAFARIGNERTGTLPLEALHDYASPFSEDIDLRKRIQSVVRLLRIEGLSTLNDFTNLPVRSLASRFGKETLLLSDKIRNALQWVWPLFRPIERMIETIDLQDTETLGSCASLEALLFVLRGSLDRCATRLRGRSLRASRLELRLTLDSGETRVWDLPLPVPQGSAAGILPLLRDRLDFDLQRSPLSRPAVSIRLEVTETAPGHGAQNDFFDSSEREAEDWDALVGRLSQKLGKTGAFTAQTIDCHFPEKAWRPDPRKSSGGIPSKKQTADDIPINLPVRPSRVLPRPEPIRIEGTEIFYPAKGTRWTLLELQGPERLEAEWWDADSRGRDYYRVTTESGQELWIFLRESSQNQMEQQFFLHGYFD